MPPALTVALPSLANATLLTPTPARWLLLAAMLSAAVAGVAATPAAEALSAAQAAGPDLTRLLRAMALIKAVMALALLTALLWRLGGGVTPLRLAGYAAAAAAMAAGPGLIWDMAWIKSGALLLHGGLLAGLLLLWRDRRLAAMLGEIMAARRAGAAPGRAALRSSGPGQSPRCRQDH